MGTRLLLSDNWLITTHALYGTRSVLVHTKYQRGVNEGSMSINPLCQITMRQNATKLLVNVQNHHTFHFTANVMYSYIKILRNVLNYILSYLLKLQLHIK